MTLTTPDPGRLAADRECRTTPLFMLRVAGLPVESIVPLRTPRTARWAEDVLDAESRLDAARDVIGDALAAAVGDNPDEGARRQLLALRRTVFNRRLPKDAAAARRVADGIDGRGRAALTGWLDGRAALEELLGQGEDVLAEETALARAHLRRLAGDPRLRHGLLLSSASLDQYLPTYVDGPAAAGKRGRRIERSLLEYVYRTACKTSPFSTLTGVSVGRFAPGAGSVVPTADVTGPWRSHARLNVAALARLSQIVLDDPAARADLPVRLTSGLQADRTRLRYVRRTQAAGDDSATMTFDSVRESLFYLSRGTVLQEIIDILGVEPELRVAGLAARLRAADPSRDAADLDDFLGNLIRLSLLTVPVLRVDIHAPDPVAAFAAGVRALDRPWSRGLADSLDGVAELVRSYPPADLDGRRRLLGRLRTELEGVQSALGAEQPSTPRTLVYEDVSVAAGAVVDVDAWRAGIEPALRSVSRLLPVLDPMAPQRINLQAFYAARFGRGGRCDDVLRFVHEFHQDFYDQYIKAQAGRVQFDADGEFSPNDNWLRAAGVDAMADARRELIRRLRAARAGAGPADEIVLGEDVVDAVAAALPPRAGTVDARSFFLQVAATPDGPLAVLNRSYSGLTLTFSRFVHCFDDGRDGGTDGDSLTRKLRAELGRLQPAGTVFAEMTGGFDTTNLNLHPAVTPYELVCPGDVSSRPVAEQLAVEDLSVVQDEHADRLLLWSRTLQAEVLPVYLGFLMPMALPEVQRTLLLFSRATMVPLDLWSGVDGRPDPATVRYRPRLRYRDLVLARRSWTIHPGRLPARAETAGDAAWFLAWQRLRRELGLPRRVFASLDRTPVDTDAPGPAGPTKPQYVDFDSPLSLGLLETSLRSANRYVVLQEMAPDTAEQWLRDADGTHVTELTVELTELDLPTGEATR